MRRKRLIIVLACATAAVLLAVLLWPRPEGLYRVTLLPSMGGRMMAATGINEHGQVTGYGQNADGVFHFFLWDRESGLRDLGRASQANVYLNDAGQIAGTTQDAGGNSLALFWDPVQGVQMLGTLGGKDSTALGLNNRGQVVGRAQTGAGVSRAFVWDQATGMRDLGTLGGSRSEALSINDAGLIFGQADSATQEYCPFFWDSGKGMSAAGTPGLIRARGFCMNNHGYALGVNDDGQVSLWRPDGAVRRLFRGGGSPVLPVLNDVNQVIFGESSHIRAPAWAQRFFRVRLRCFLWDPRRGRVALDNGVPRGPGENLYVCDLNNQGCIVGALVNEWLMQARAVLLEPIPERWGKRPPR